MVVKKEFRSAPGEGEAGQANRMLFFLSFFCFFSCVWWEGRKRKEKRGASLGRRENLGWWATIDERGTEKGIPLKLAAIVSAAR